MSASGSLADLSASLDNEWLRLYSEEYWTLEEIAVSEGVTREGIRQRLLKLGIVPRTNQETLRLREARETAVLAEELKGRLLALRNYEAVASDLGLPVAWVKRFAAREIPDYSVLFRSTRSQAKRYSSEELVDSLRAAALTNPGNLTKEAYDAWQTTAPDLGSGRLPPGSQVMMIRFGSWREALDAAGLPSNPHSGPDKTYDAAQALDAVVAAWREIGVPPRVVDYEAWSRNSDGQPSPATVRKLMGSWDELLIRAWQLVHGQLLDQSDPDAELPASVIEGVAVSTDRSTVTYRRALEGTEIALPSGMVTANYESLERAVQAHARIQNAIVDAALEVGVAAYSPASGSPLFDVALAADDGRFWVVEVKSSTPQNRELQLRIALGQVLHYAHQLRPAYPSVVPVIGIEEEPGDLWRALLGDLGVGLIVDIDVDVAALVSLPAVDS